MLDRFVHPPAIAAERPVSLTAGWLKPQRLDYLPLDDELAVVRLVAQLRSGYGPPPSTTLVVGGAHAVLRRDPLGSLTHRVARRFRGANDLLWRATFALPLELVEFPEAVLGLVAAGYEPTRLPDPTLATLAALSEPWPVGPSGAALLGSGAMRRAAALGAVIAVAGSSSVSPALALAGSGGSGGHGTSSAAGQHCRVTPASPSASLSTARNGTTPCPADWAPAPASNSDSHASGHSASPVGHVTSSSHAPRATNSKPAHAKARLSSHSTPTASSKHAVAAKGSRHPSLVSVTVASGTIPGPESRAPSTHAALSALGGRGHSSNASVGVARAGERSSKLSPIPPGSLKGSLTPTFNGAVGHAPQDLRQGGSGRHGDHHSASAPGHQPHPQGANRNQSAAPKTAAQPSVNSTPDSDSDSSLAPGSNPFTTPSSLYTRLASMYSHLDQPPPFLIPIYKKAGARYHIPWSILAAINSVETDYGRDVNTSSAGAIGWMQFMPSTWAQYGVAVDHAGPPNPYNPADAIFSAAKYLAANGGAKNIRQAIFAYNHAQWYVNEVMGRALLIRDHTKGGLISPFPLGWVPNRLDMGYDGTFTGAIVAPFSGTITFAARSFSNWGGYIELKADHPIPGLQSDTLYFAEGLAPAAKTGQHVAAGQVIAVAAPSPYGDAYATTASGAGQIEWGLASPGVLGTPTNPLAESESRPANMVINFALWVIKNLGLTPPSQTNHAGYA